MTNVMSPAAEYAIAQARFRLLSALRHQAVYEGVFVLSSGRRASYYVDCSSALYHPAQLRDLKAVMAGSISQDIQQICGPLTGAIPMLFASSLGGFLIRDNIKPHGTGGRFVGIYRTDAPTLLVDDVASTGDTLLESLRACEAESIPIRGAWVLVDRDKGACEKLRSEGLTYHAEFTLQDLGVE